MIKRVYFVILLLLTGLGLLGCATSPPNQIDNICHIFDEKRGWYKDARAAERRWGSSIPVLMAIMHRESGFRPTAKPPRGRILWIIPWRRHSSAYGYAQAKNETWAEYRIDSGNHWAARNNFDDAIDFVGWYNAKSRQRSNIALNDAYSLYLAYHEGQGGFNRGTYRSKAWLLDVARQVDKRAQQYAEQLKGCEHRLRRPWWWPF